MDTAKKYFFTGLIILLPLAFTFIVAKFMIDLMTIPFEGIVRSILANYSLLDKPLLFLSGEQVLHISSKIMAIALFFGILILIGFFGRLVIGKAVFNFGTRIIQYIPFVNKIYKTVEDGVVTAFGSSESSFSQAVVVPYPHKDVYSVGLVAKKQTAKQHDEDIFVFIPGTPNPTAGYIVSYKYEDIEFLDMKVDEAVKFVLSCGIMSNGFHK